MKCVTCCALSALLLSTPVNAMTLFVKPNGTGTGSTWGNAASLQTALGAAQSADQIWCMEGTYKPGAQRTDTFTLVTGAAVLGGFAGTETLETQRNPAQHVTILSGDIDTGGNLDSYHVVTVPIPNVGVFQPPSGMGFLGNLDGFTVTMGYASGTGNEYGAGIKIAEGGKPLIRQCIITYNHADNGGGGAHAADGSEPTFRKCTFSNNDSDFSGGALEAGNNTKPTLLACTFTANHADSIGGAYYSNRARTVKMISCDFNGNSAASNRGAVYVIATSAITTALSITNCKFTNNSLSASSSQGGGLY